MLIVLYVVLILIALLVSIVLFTKISILIDVKKPSEGSVTGKLEINVFGKKINLSRFINRDKKEETEKPKREKIKKKLSLKQSLYNIRIGIARGKYTYLLSKRYIRKKIKIENIDFNMTFGTDDAAHTGIATGAVWGSLYSIFGFLSSLCTVKSHNFIITPVFEDECFSFDFNSKINLRIINILSVLFAVMINYLKSKKLIGKDDLNVNTN